MESVFRLSMAANIAIHSVAFLTYYKDAYLSASWLGKAMGVSSAHLSKVLNKMVDKKYLVSSRGASGGFRLNFDPSKTTLLEIIEAVDGKIKVNSCLLNKPICEREECAFTDLEREIAELLIKKLSSLTVQDFVESIRVKVNID